MTLLQSMAANSALLRLSWGLCRGFLAAERLWPGTAARNARNREARAALPAGERISGQQQGPAAGLPYGRFRMSYNGCEVIACYNALRLLGLPGTPGETADWFEGHGLVLDGLWGSHPLAVPAFFATRGVGTRTLTARDAGDFDREFAGVRAAVFAFWNDAKRLRSGVHTVSLSHAPGGGLAVDNLDGVSPVPCTAYRSVAELVARRNLLPIVLILLEEREDAHGSV